jgi:hypothetical protein
MDRPVSRRLLWIALTAIVLFFLGLPLVAVKALMVRGLPRGLRLVRATPEELQRFDRKAIDGHQRELEALGFRDLGDFTIAFDEAPAPMPALVRVLAQHEARCIADISQTLPPPGEPPSPVGLDLSSALEPGWLLTTTNRRPNAINYMLRMPKSAWKALPGARAGALLSAHRERLRELASRHQLSVADVPSLEIYLALSVAYHQRLADAFAARNPVGLAYDGVSFWLRPRLEWGGE